MTFDFCSNDNSFGPVSQCRTFDFTIYFEQAILSILPAAILLAIAIPSIAVLIRRRRCVHRMSTLFTVKLALNTAFLVVAIVLTSVLLTVHYQEAILWQAGAALTVIEALTIYALSMTQHLHSIRPSTIMSLYLSTTTLCDIVRLRTLIFIAPTQSLVALASTSLALRVLLNFSENWSKSSILLEEFCEKSTKESVASFWSTSCQTWMLPLFNLGYSKMLNTDDLTDFYDNSVCDDDCARLQKSFRENSSVVRATIVAFKWQIIASILPGFLQIAATITQPELINRFIAFTESYWTPNPQPASFGWSLAFCFFLVYFILACAKSAYTMLNIHLMTRFQGAMIGLLFSKSLSISASENGAVLGSASTHMSVDTQKICEMMQHLHDPWQNLVSVGVILWLLYRQLQYAMFAVFGVVLITLLTPFVLTPKSVAASAEWGGQTEKRVALLTSFLQNMKAIKLSAFEKTVVEPIMENSRVAELAALGKWYKVLIASIYGGDSVQVLAVVVGFTAYALLHLRKGETLDSQTTFTALSLIIILVEPISLIIQTLPNLFAAYGGAMRLQEFLLKPDFQNIMHHSPEPDLTGPFVDLKSLSKSDTVELVAMPSFLSDQVLVRSADHIELRSATFKWHPRSDSVCLEDISICFSRGLTVIIGEVGCGKTCLLHSILGETVLTQGSMIRPDVPIALCTQDPWIRNSSLRSNIISTHPYEADWYNKVVIACDLLQDITLLKHGDQTMIGSKGQNLSGGQKQRVALARAVYSRAEYFFFDDIFSAIDKGTEALIFAALFGTHGLLKTKTVLLVSHGISRLSAADKIVLLSAGKVVEQGSWSEIAHHGRIATLLTDAKTTQDSSNGQTSEEKKLVALGEECEAPEVTNTIHYERGWSIYVWYLSTLGKGSIFMAVVSVVVYTAANTGTQLWLRRWADQKDSTKDLKLYIAILWLFFFFYSAGWIVNLVTVCWLWSIKAGSAIHRRLLSGVLSTRFSFFNTNSVGFVLNRFSQDVFALDFEIPIGMAMLMFPLFGTISQIGVVCAAVPYVAITLPFLLYGLYLLQKYYLRTSRQVKTIALESKTPLYTSFLETLEGVITIRSAREEAACVKANNVHLAHAQPSFFLSFAVMRSVTMVLDVTLALLVTCIAILAVVLRHSTSGGLIGLALIQIIQLQVSFNQIIFFVTTLETGMVAVERIKEFSSLPKEDPNPSAEHGDWLKSGHIVYRNVSAKYSNDEGAPNALYNLDFEIPAGHKIGVCGRTGSGKSSLLLTLFRAMDCQTGEILIDGLNTSLLSLYNLRSHITIVPQDPALWHGTLRANLDPLHACTDSEIWTAIAQVNLTDLITNLAGSLDYQLDASASFSAGQRQLVCLARACLRRSKIVVLDEATSSMDVLTDQVVQRVVREVFRDATVITIAHRIQTILDYDRIMVLDRGSLVEYDEPKTLLGDPDSILSAMVRGERIESRTQTTVQTINDSDEIEIIQR